MKSLPEVFDKQFYRAIHSDLLRHSDAALTQHYQDYGKREGRAASRGALREHFLSLVPTDSPSLEIGPFCSPCLHGPNIAYFDVLDQAGLNQRAVDIGIPANAPEIDFVDQRGDLSVIPRKFTTVLSSHCIEHQPDLVRHLQQVGDLLVDGGRYMILIPDRRYCFDHFIAPSTLALVLDAHRERRTTHRLSSVIEHRALTTHNDPGRHWAGDHTDPGFENSQAERARAAMIEFDAANGAYIDVHAWQFEPDTFTRIISDLRALGLIGLQVERVYQTPHGRNEFTASLIKVAETA